MLLSLLPLIAHCVLPPRPANPIMRAEKPDLRQLSNSKL
jgi:hypothetical protein